MEIFRAQDLMLLIERYMDEASVRKVYDAFLLAVDAHNGVVRKDGVTPYVTHPVEVACILASLYLDADTLCAALLHDVLEDTHYQHADLSRLFGKAVADLVDGVTKLEKSEELTTKQAVTIASYRKLMCAMTNDFRVVLIKLADRLHNMSTLGNMDSDARRRIAKETLASYIPLARRFGLNQIRRELQKYVFKNLYPWRSPILEHALEVYLQAHEQEYEAITRQVNSKLSASIPTASAFIWEKNLFRMYERRKHEGITFRQQCDLLEIRVLVREREECYLALGILHELYRPILGKLNDFIATPKGGYGFQALQTTVIANEHQLVRFQIQTHDMFHVAQYGLAAQWRYPDMRKTGKAEYTQAALKRWLLQVKELESQADTPDEFYQDMQADLFQTEIYAYTPRGDVKDFPKGATLVDFAYAIHTQLGHHCVRAKVDGVERPLYTPIPHMSVVEIITDSSASPQPSWLHFVVTGRAKSSIRAWIRLQTAENQCILGKERFISALRGHGCDLSSVDRQHLEATLKASNYETLEALYQAIGRGDECPRLFSERLLGNLKEVDSKQDAPLLIKGASGLAITIAPCCLPLPTEPILARRNQQHGLEIHRADCVHIGRLQQGDSLFPVAWAQDMGGKKFLAEIVIEVRDVLGMLHNITKRLAEMDVNIENLNITGVGSVKQDRLTIQVNDLRHLQEAMRQLKRIPNVLNVSRLTKKDSHESHHHFYH